MERKKNISTKNLDKLTFSDYFISFCLFVIIVIIPLIVKVAYVKVSGDEYGVIRDSAGIYDSFSYYKSNLILIFSTILFIYKLADFFISENEFKLSNYKNPIYICSFIYIIFAVISSVFSKYKSTSFFGIGERYEGLFILISYFIIFFTTMNYSKGTKKINILSIFFILSGFFVGIVGFFQFLGMDLFTTDFGKRLILGSLYADKKDTITSVFTQVYTTLFNPNCVGLFTALLIPPFLFYGLVYSKKKPLPYILFALCAILVCCLIGSQTEAGYIGLFAELSLGYILGTIYIIKFSNSQILKKLCWAFSGVVLFTIVLGGYYFKDNIYKAFVSVFNLEGTQYTFPVRDYSVDKNQVSFDTENGKVFLEFNNSNNEYIVKDSNKNVVPFEKEEFINKEKTAKYFTCNVPGIGLVEVQNINSICMVRLLNTIFMFTNTPDGNITALDKKYTPVDISQKVPSIGFSGVENMASGRGYIWSRSLPIFFKHILMGSGPDTYTLIFPQYDLLGKLKYLGDPYIIVDKPHNLYLQVGINTGILSLLALLGLFGYYFFTTLKSVFNEKNKDKFLTSLAIGILCAIVGYLVCALSTDSVVSVAPLFWAALGFGFSINQQIVYNNTHK